MAKKKWHVVTVGTQPGIYETWTEAAPKIRGVPGSIWESFPTPDEAQRVFDKALADGTVKAVRMTMHGQADDEEGIIDISPPASPGPSRTQPARAAARTRPVTRTQSEPLVARSPASPSGSRTRRRPPVESSSAPVPSPSRRPPRLAPSASAPLPARESQDDAGRDRSRRPPAPARGGHNQPDPGEVVEIAAVMLSASLSRPVTPPRNAESQHSAASTSSSPDTNVTTYGEAVNLSDSSTDIESFVSQKGWPPQNYKPVPRSQRPPAKGGLKPQARTSPRVKSESVDIGARDELPQASTSSTRMRTRSATAGGVKSEVKSIKSEPSSSKQIASPRVKMEASDPQYGVLSSSSRAHDDVKTQASPCVKTGSRSPQKRQFLVKKEESSDDSDGQEYHSALSDVPESKPCQDRKGKSRRLPSSDDLSQHLPVQRTSREVQHPEHPSSHRDVGVSTTPTAPFSPVVDPAVGLPSSAPSPRRVPLPLSPLSTSISSPSPMPLSLATLDSPAHHIPLPFSPASSTSSTPARRVPLPASPVTPVAQRPRIPGLPFYPPLEDVPVVPASPSALGLIGFSQPMHSPRVVYESGADPRSPIRRPAVLPLNDVRSPVFGRPTPQMPGRIKLFE